ncbi:MAG TPA: hypothetical protein VMV94_15705 [Phycisphaerae bacterium]|nr:hypothetical protein [Phycisphaerae bacterium]
MRAWRSIVCMAVAAGILTAIPAVASAQNAALEAQNKLLSKRAAEADAYRKLAETVNGVQINAETYVRDFIAEADTIRTDLDTYIRGIRLGEPHWASDLTCTVEAEVTVAKLIEELKSLHSRHYKGDKVKATDFDSIKQYIKKDVIKAVGMGAPRPDLPPGVPGGDIPMPPDVKLPPDPPIPDIWKSVPPNERLMAIRAANVDAKRRLVERIKGLRINSQTVVRDFVAASDEINTECDAMLVGAQEVGRPYLHFDELIAEVTLEVPVESVITTIKSLHTRHYKGDKVKGSDIEQITQNIKSQTFKATGMGVPRPQVIQAAMTQMQVKVPDWVGQTLQAEGQGVPPPNMEGPQAKLMAARAAELDAKRKLGERVMGLVIESSTTVRDFVAQHDDINTQLNAYLTGSYVKSTSYAADGTATVTVEMPAMPVWEVVHTYMRMVQR